MTDGGQGAPGAAARERPAHRTPVAIFAHSRQGIHPMRRGTDQEARVLDGVGHGQRGQALPTLMGPHQQPLHIAPVGGQGMRGFEGQGVQPDPQGLLIRHGAQGIEPCAPQIGTTWHCGPARSRFRDSRHGSAYTSHPGRQGSLQPRLMIAQPLHQALGPIPAKAWHCTPPGAAVTVHQSHQVGQLQYAKRP